MTPRIEAELDRILAAIPVNVALSRLAIWHRAGQMGAPSSIDLKLDELQRRGLVTRTKEPIPNGWQWVYRRVTQPVTTASPPMAPATDTPEPEHADAEKKS